MRCKNCGTDNDDNRYICETCGSPLYDEDELNDIASENDSQASVQNNGYNSKPNSAMNGNDDNDSDNKEQMKKSVITIAILVVILVAIIASVAVIASTRAKTPENETQNTSELTTEDISSYTTEKTTKPTTQKTTKKETTTKPTTTEKPTTAQTWIINASSSGGGDVSGAGEYENGEKVTLVATADEGYKFDGWYSNGVKVSSSKSYTFKANENASFSAVFYVVEITTEQTQATEPDEDTEIMFGDND